MTLDFYFKKVYGSEDPRVKEGMKKFLSSVIKKKVIDYDILNSELLGITRDSKSQVVDLHIRTSENEKILVEMQISAQDDKFLPRVFHAGQRLFSNQLKKGDEYKDLKKVYVIAFIDKKSNKNLYEHIENVFITEEQTIFKSVDYHLFYLKNLYIHSKINVNSYDEQFLKLLKEPFSNDIKDDILKNFVEVISEMGMDKESFEIMIEECNEIYMNSIKGDARREGKAEGRKETIDEVVSNLLTLNIEEEKISTIIGFDLEETKQIISRILNKKDYKL